MLTSSGRHSKATFESLHFFSLVTVFRFPAGFVWFVHRRDNRGTVHYSLEEGDAHGTISTCFHVGVYDASRNVCGKVRLQHCLIVVVECCTTGGIACSVPVAVGAAEPRRLHCQIAFLTKRHLDILLLCSSRDIAIIQS